MNNMLFWTLAALLTLAAALAVMLPFLWGGGGAASEAEHDLAVYRDQLAELEREVQRGLISEANAEEARAEIARRILRLKGADEEGRSSGVRGQGKLARIIAMVAILGVPAISWGLYGVLGSPNTPAQPLAARLSNDPSQASIEELVARAEAHLAANPGDVRGWEVLAPIYARLGRYGDAATAYGKVIELAGSTAEREAALGEALVGTGGGIVTEDAEAAFDRALTLDAANPRARFFIAMARAQEGKPEEARTIWQELAATMEEGSPWRLAAGQALASLAARERGASAPGPSEEDMAAADGMTREARQEMIEGMVASLDAKLQENPDDPEAWRMLLRSFVVLGRPDEAEAALARAREALGPQSAEAGKLEEFAAGLGLGTKE